MGKGSILGIKGIVRPTITARIKGYFDFIISFLLRDLVTLMKTVKAFSLIFCHQLKEL